MFFVHQRELTSVVDTRNDHSAKFVTSSLENVQLNQNKKMYV